MSRLRRIQIVLVTLVPLLLLVSVSTMAQSSIPDDPKSIPTPTAPFDPEEMLPDDIMGPQKPAGYRSFPSSAVDFRVVPILFVPNDLTPNPLGLQYINRLMQMIQRWYGEQLRGQTFRLEPVRVVRGTYALRHYYGDCFPPNASCSWGYQLWNHVFADLAGLGYPWRHDQIHGVFFQSDGVGGTALGGGNRFLVGLGGSPAGLIDDCLFRGCAAAVREGGVSHELGHALGLPHTASDPEGSPGKSVMSYGFYGFPQATFVNTSTNPERDHLYASPFINTVLLLNDGGFEDCLASWSVAAGAPSCTTTAQRSGLSALRLTPNSATYRVNQEIQALAEQTYDVSGWIKIASQSAGFTLKVRVVALSAAQEVLARFLVANCSATTTDWERFSASLALPPETVLARVEIVGKELGATAYVDDIDFRLAQQPPPTPLPIFYYDRDAVPTLEPTLMWSDTTAATSFRLQVSPDPTFRSLTVDATSSSPFYTIPGGLAFDTRYFWRVKAINGVGESNWSAAWSFIPRSASDYYNDEFETGTLDSSWSWIREDPSHWSFGGPLGRRHYGYLGITTQAGDLHSGDNAKNLLLKDPPSGDFQVSTKVDFWAPIDANYQQGGLLIYQDDQNYVQLTRIYSDTYGYLYRVEVDGVIVHQDFTPLANTVPMWIARTGNTYSSHYTTDGFDSKRFGQPTTVNWSDPKIGLMAYSVLDVEQVTAYFDWFRVTGPPFQDCHVRLNNDPTTYASTQAAVDASTQPTDVVKVAGYCAGVTAQDGVAQTVYLSKTLTLQGGWNTAFTQRDAEKYPTTLDAQGRGRVLNIRWTDATIEGLRATGGDATGFGGGEDDEDAGGGIFIMGSSTIKDNWMFGNSAVTGGGLYYYAGSGTIIGNVVISNTGGGLALSSGAHALSDNTISNNTGTGLVLFDSDGATLSGNTVSGNSRRGLVLAFTQEATLSDNTISNNGDGGLELFEGDATLSGNTFSGNTAGEGFGGGLSVGNGGVTLIDNTFSGNTAWWGGGLDIGWFAGGYLSGNVIYSNTAQFGGGLSISMGGATLTGNTIFSNTAESGGGLYVNDEGHVTLSDNAIHDNIASDDGGGLCLVGGSSATMKDNTLSVNIAGDRGGGLYLENSDATLSSNFVSTNSAEFGGGLYLYGSDGTLSGNTIYANSADSGGGLYLHASPAALSGNTVSLNTSTTSGGGLRLRASDARLENNVVADNQAGGVGGGLYVKASAPRLLHTTLARNSARDGSGIRVGGSSTVALTNTILVSHALGLYVDSGGTVQLEGTLWGDGAWANHVEWDGEGTILTGSVNIWGQPHFLDPDHGDYHLQMGSAAIDAGVDAGVKTDMDGEARPQDGDCDGALGFDIGADEHMTHCIFRYLPTVLKAY